MRGHAWARLKTPIQLTFPGNSDAVQPGFLEVQMKGLRDTKPKRTLLQLRNPGWDRLYSAKTHIPDTNC